MESILTSIKKLLGNEADYTHFDPEIIMFINSVFMKLMQLGVGVDTGFKISTGDEVWSDFLGDNTDLEAVKTYVYLNVRIIFDPPSSSFVLEAMHREIKELEWRLNAQVDPKE